MAGGSASQESYIHLVQRAVEEADCGLYPPDLHYEEFRKARLKKGYEVIEPLLERFDIRATATTLRLARISGQGYVIGEELYSQLCDKSEQRSLVVNACALLNLLVACFDAVLDERPESAAALLSTITRPLVVDALRIDRSKQETVFCHEDRGDLAISFVTFVAEEFFNLARQIGGMNSRPELWSQFCTAIVDAYDAEIDTSRRTFGEAASIELATKLSCKSAFPNTIIGMLVLMSPDLRPTVKSDQIHEIMSLIGAAVGQLDDIVDLEKDLHAQHWNTLLLGLKETPEEQIQRFGVAGVLHRLVQHGHLHLATKRLATLLHDVEMKSAAFPDSERLVRSVRCWLAGWLVTRGDSRGTSSAERRPRAGVSGAANSLSSDLLSAIEGGLDFLTRLQDPDGLYRDFALPPGPSNGWVTAFVSVAMNEATKVCEHSGSVAASAKAAKALISNSRSTGWGYNGQTATDADSTAFAIRAILGAGMRLPRRADVLLSPFVDSAGHGHTFHNSCRMGNWADAHADVSPSIGLALQAADEASKIRSQLVQASLQARLPNGIWPAYWWRYPYYSTQMNLAWLRSQGALTPSLASSALGGLCQLDVQQVSVFDVASLLTAIVEIRSVVETSLGERNTQRLVTIQKADGGWPRSRCLGLPSQRPKLRTGTGGSDISETPYYIDGRRIFTTAAVVQALARFLQQLRT